MSNEHDDKENMRVRVTRKLRKKTEIIITIIIIKNSYYKLNNKTVDKPSMRKNEKKKKGKASGRCRSSTFRPPVLSVLSSSTFST